MRNVWIRLTLETENNDHSTQTLVDSFAGVGNSFC